MACILGLHFHFSRLRIGCFRFVACNLDAVFAFHAYCVLGALLGFSLCAIHGATYVVLGLTRERRETNLRFRPLLFNRLVWIQVADSSGEVQPIVGLCFRP